MVSKYHKIIRVFYFYSVMQYLYIRWGPLVFNLWNVHNVINQRNGRKHDLWSSLHDDTHKYHDRGVCDHSYWCGDILL